MNKPNRNSNARYRTVDQVIQEANLCRNTVVNLAKEAGAYIHIGRAVRVDIARFFDYVGDSYSEK